jgi:Flp pilus assembly protein TadG
MVMLVKAEDGTVTVLFAVSMIAVLGMVGLAIDVGQLRVAKHNIQLAADAAAVAGALEIPSCGGTSACQMMLTAAQSALVENRLQGSTLLTNCYNGTNGNLELTVNNGPCALGTSDPNSGNINFVEALISYKQSTSFARVLGIQYGSIAARAEATTTASDDCVYTLASSGVGLLVQANGSVSGSNLQILLNCGIRVNSSASTALTVSSGMSVTASAVGVVGGYVVEGGGSINPTPTTGATPARDILARMSPPSFSPGTCQPNPNVTTTQTLGPASPAGAVCYNGLSIGGSGTTTLNPGLYIINGQMNVTTSGLITGTGVSFYIAPGGSVNVNGGGTLKLSAPTNGMYNGILLFQDRQNTNQLMFTNSSASTLLQGIFYAANASLVFTGNAQGSYYSSFVTSSLTIGGAGTFSNYALVNKNTPLRAGVLLVQ